MEALLKETNRTAKILFTEEQILAKAKELGAKITEDFKGEELILVGTLKGAILWMCDLMKRIDLDTQIDFMTASSYGASTVSSGFIEIKKDVELPLKGKNVLIVEDIIDTGITISRLKARILKEEPKCVKVCTLLDKPSRREIDVKAEYTAYEIEDLFVIGYGLDYDQRYRNLPYITYLAE